MPNEMIERRLEVFEDSDTSSSVEIRFFEEDRMHKRRVDALEVDELINAVEAVYGQGEIAPRTFGHRALLELGERLYRFVDGDDRWLAKLNESPGTLLRIDAKQRFRHLPWELIADGGHKAVNVAAPVSPVRTAVEGPAAAAATPAANRPLRVLFMAASPENSQELNYELEERWILEATEVAGAELVVEESGTLPGLQYLVDRYGAGYFDVLHLSGHANVLESTPLFQLEDELGMPAATTPDDLVGALRGRWPRLVFVSGCLTGSSPNQGKLPSMAESIVRAGAEHVLGWGLPVGDLAASQFASALYRSLATGHPIDLAVTQAREELHANKSAFWHYLRHYSTKNSPTTPMVTAPGTIGRERPSVSAASDEFLDPDTQQVRVASRENFVGRRRAIQRCLRVLRGNEFEGVVLQGMGGLGKSTMASRLLERMPRHQRVVWFKRVDNVRFGELVGKVDFDDVDISVQAEGILGHPDADLDTRVRYLLSGPLQNIPCLFVFDDFEDGNLEARDDGYVCEPESQEILGALIRGIRKTGSPSRVIITSRYEFPVPQGGNLHLEKLGTLTRNEQTKKVNNLAHLQASGGVPDEVRNRALEAAGGNPRLLDWLNKVVGDSDTDSDRLLEAIEEETDRFLHENIFATTLLEMQSAEVQNLLARLNVIDLPIPRPAVEAIDDHPESATHIDRAAKVGLLEVGHDTSTGGKHFFVSNVLRPLLNPVLDESQFVDACAAAAQALYRLWIDDGESENADESENR